MPNDLKDLAPHFPWEGPPLPRGKAPPWPTTPADVERAVYAYRESMFRAVERYRMRIPIAVENFRLSLLRRLP